MLRFVQLLYYALFPLLFFATLPFYLIKMIRRGGYHKNFLERLGIFDPDKINRIGQGRIWIHAVSVGEILMALKWIKGWQEQHPQAKILLSTTTSTGMAIAQKKRSSSLEVIANPLDLWWIAKKTIRLFQPKALLFIEADLWPARIRAAQKAQIPVALLNARLSPRSEKRFQKLHRWIIPFFNNLDLITFPTLSDQERWHRIGIYAHQARCTGNIKYDTLGSSDQPPPSSSESTAKSSAENMVAKLIAQLGWQTTHLQKDPIFLAGSTHPYEEKLLLQTWQKISHNYPQLRIIIAPRHVERTPELISLIKKMGITFQQRSCLSQNSTQLSQESITSSSSPPSLLLLDTTGELLDWYSKATIVFIGKSLSIAKNHGGQNPVEPLQAGAAVLTGPHMENFEPLISELRQAGGVITIKDSATLERALTRLLNHPDQRQTLITAAHKILQKDQGAIIRNCEAVQELLKKTSSPSTHYA